MKKVILWAYIIVLGIVIMGGILYYYRQDLSIGQVVIMLLAFIYVPGYYWLKKKIGLGEK